MQQLDIYFVPHFYMYIGGHTIVWTIFCLIFNLWSEYKY